MRARELTAEEAERPLGWQYPDPFSTYDAEGTLKPELGYFAVEEDGDLVGYGVAGAEARVSGVEEEAGTIDIGYGMRPDLIGQGRGRVRRRDPRACRRRRSRRTAPHVDPRLERPLAPRRRGARLPVPRAGRRVRRARARSCRVGRGLRSTVRADARIEP